MSLFFVILCAGGLQTEVITQSLIGGNWVKDNGGNVYVVGYGPYTVQDSGTHTNISVQTLETLAENLPSLGKSVSVSGIENYQAFLSQFGFVRCGENGNEFSEDAP